MLSDFLRMLVQPGAAIDRLRTTRPDLAALVTWVCIAGTVRWAVEGLWLLIMAGQLHVLFARGLVGTWYLDAVPFLIANLLTAVFRWGLFALVPYALGRFVGGQGRWSDFLSVYGLAMGIYVVTILPNFAYLTWDLPAVHFEVARTYAPLFGVGQVITSVWLMWLGYVTARRLHRLPAVESILIGIAVPTANVGLYVTASWVFFNLQPLAKLSRIELLWVAGVAFGVVVAAAIPGLFWLGHRVARTERVLGSQVEA